MQVKRFESPQQTQTHGSELDNINSEKKSFLEGAFFSKEKKGKTITLRNDNLHNNKKHLIKAY